MKNMDLELSYHEAVGVYTLLSEAYDDLSEEMKAFLHKVEGIIFQHLTIEDVEALQKESVRNHQ